MGKYNFGSMDFIASREGTWTNAVDRIPIPGATIKEGFSKIPMWVADMNVPTYEGSVPSSPTTATSISPRSTSTPSSTGRRPVTALI